MTKGSAPRPAAPVRAGLGIDLLAVAKVRAPACRAAGYDLARACPGNRVERRLQLGKSTIARCLQSVLAEPWLTLGTDKLVEAMPASMRAAGAGIGFGGDGSVSVGPAFRARDVTWASGIAAMVRAGARVIVDEAFIGGASSQQRWQTALAGLGVL